MEAFFLHHAGQLHLFAYAVFIVGMFIEGDGIVFSVAFIAHRKHINPAAAILAIFVATILSDITWYYIGAYLQTKDNFLVRWAKRLTNPLSAHLVERPRHSLILAKFLYGINHAIWAKAGAMGLPLRKLLGEDILATIIWMFIIGGLGIASSAGFIAAKHYIRYGELGLLAGLALLIICSKIFTHFFKKKL